jgi:hypothetical protein
MNFDPPRRRKHRRGSLGSKAWRCIILGDEAVGIKHGRKTN